MDRNARTGRMIGAALLACALLEGWSNFGLQPQLFDGGGFLANAGGQPRTVGLIIVMGLLAGVLSLCAATMLAVSQKDDFPVHSRIYLLLTAVALAATLAELSTLVAMRDGSELFAGAGADAGSRFEIARSILRGLRNGLHFSTKTFEGLNLLVFFLLLYRANAVPLLLAGVGMPAALLQMVAVGRPLFGQEVSYTLLAPIGVAYLATALWLLVKGLPRSPG
jgi:hypothetical protein